MLTLIALSLVTTANAAPGTTQTTDLDGQELVNVLGAQQAQLQALEAELAARRACAPAACPPPVVTPAPASKPKAATKAPAKPAPKATTPAAPKTVVVPAAPAVPDPRIAELEEEIAFLRGQLAKPAAPINVTVPAPIVNITVPQAAPPSVIVNPTVERHTSTEVRSAGSRIHFGLAEMGTVAPPLPGSATSVVDRTEVLVRYEWAVGESWIGLEVDGGYGFVADSTSIRALPTFTASLGSGTDLNLGVGVSYLCESAFTGGPLCSAARTGGQAQVGIAQQLGPIAGELFVGGGYDMVDSSEAGIGGVGYGFGGFRVFVGTVGKTEMVTVR